MPIIDTPELFVDTLTVGPFETNCYLLADPRSKSAWLIDAGMDPDALIRWVARSGFTLRGLLLTHGHIDHAAGNKRVKERFGVPISIHRDDEPMLSTLELQGRMFGVATDNSPPPDAYLEEGQTLELGALRAAVLHTPGHTPGGVCFWLEAFGLVFAGDTLFSGSIGRTDLPGGDHAQLLDSIRQKLMRLDDETLVLPGHMGLTKIGLERQYNPFL